MYSMAIKTLFYQVYFSECFLLWQLFLLGFHIMLLLLLSLMVLLLLISLFLLLSLLLLLLLLLLNCFSFTEEEATIRKESSENSRYIKLIL